MRQRILNTECRSRYEHELELERELKLKLELELGASQKVKFKPHNEPSPMRYEAEPRNEREFSSSRSSFVTRKKFFMMNNDSHTPPGRKEKVVQGNSEETFFNIRLDLLIALVLILAILAVYWQMRSYEFIDFDDNFYVTDNPHVQAGLTRESIVWAFTASHAANWHPITWLSHMLDVELYGMNPGQHHLTNLLFHIANTLLLFFVLKRMTEGARGKGQEVRGEPRAASGPSPISFILHPSPFTFHPSPLAPLWPSTFVAALFALHPLHVESVAWVSERKDVLSTFFWMLTLWAYARYAEDPKWGTYLLTILFFALGLMAKPMLVTLPFVLLLLDHWPLNRCLNLSFAGENVRDQNSDIETRNLKSTHHASRIKHLLLEKLPFFILAALSSAVTFVVQQSWGAVISLERYPLDMRIANALISYISYIGKMIWPSELAFLYPYPPRFPWWKVAGACAMLIVISVIVIRHARRHPCLAVGWLWYVGTLVPVIGLVQVGTQSMADRYTYIPLIGLFVMVAWGIPELTAKWRHGKFLLGGLTAALLLLFSAVSNIQVGYWRNSIALFEHAIDVTSGNYAAHNNLGTALHKQGRIAEAIRHYSETLRLKPNFPDTHNNMGLALAAQGKTAEAAHHYSEALRSNPGNPSAYNHMGTLLEKQGRIPEAIRYYTRALRSDPEYVNAHVNLGAVLYHQGKTDEAIAHFREAVRINPYHSKARNNLGSALFNTGNVRDAAFHFHQALKRNPGDAAALRNLKKALAVLENRNDK